MTYKKNWPDSYITLQLFFAELHYITLHKKNWPITAITLAQFFFGQLQTLHYTKQFVMVDGGPRRAGRPARPSAAAGTSRRHVTARRAASGQHAGLLTGRPVAVGRAEQQAAPGPSARPEARAGRVLALHVRPRRPYAAGPPCAPVSHASHLAAISDQHFDFRAAAVMRPTMHMRLLLARHGHTIAFIEIAKCHLTSTRYDLTAAEQ